MGNIKPIETEYKGYKFRSRLEARWAVFFDSMGIEWEYETEGYVLKDGTKYLPDFLLLHIQHEDWHELVLPDYPQEYKSMCFVEVKGVMTDYDLKKVAMFAEEKPIILLGGIPKDVDEAIARQLNNRWEIDTGEYYISVAEFDSSLLTLGLDGRKRTDAFFTKNAGRNLICSMADENWGGEKFMNDAFEKARQVRFGYKENEMHALNKRCDKIESEIRQAMTLLQQERIKQRQ